MLMPWLLLLNGINLKKIDLDRVKNNLMSRISLNSGIFISAKK